MKSFYNKRYLSAATALLSAFVLSVACTSVDDTLGAGLIPGGGEKLSIHIDTLGLGEGERIRAFQTYTDSIGLRASTKHMRGAMNVNVGYIGSAEESFFGKTVAASVFSGLPAQALTPNFFKNRKSPFDSVKLIVNMKYVCGDPSVRQTFNIYRLRDSLAYTTDTIYYHSFRYEDHIDSEPLFSFEYSGEPDEIEEIKLDILPQGQLLLDELAAADTTLFYSDKAYEFLRKYKGFVIAQAPGTPANAAIYANYLPNCNMNFYFQRERDQWEIDLDDDNKEKEVTAYMQWYFSDADRLKTMSVASIRHDYTGTPLEGVQNGGEVAADETVYVQGLGGVTATLKFPDGFFDAMNALKPSEDYGLYINQAHMFVWLEGETTEAYDKAFQKLGSYSDYGSMTVIPDYYISDASTGSITIPYDGTLNRNPGKGYYRMDITSFLQHALQHDDEESRQLTLAPTYTPYEPFADNTSVLLAADSDKPVRVKITYTLIEPDGE